MEVAASPYLKHLFVCVNRRDPGVTCCAAGGLSGAASSSGSHAHTGGEAIKEKLKAYVKANGLKGKVRISSSGCMDLCAQGPNVMVEPDHRWYHHVTLEDVDRIIEKELAPLVKSEIASGASHLAAAKGGRTRSFAEVARNDGQPIRACLFDLGNVLVQFDHRAAAGEIAAHAKASPEELYRLFFESPLVIDHDEGRISTRIFYEGIKKEIGLRLEYEQFLSVWNNIFTEDRQTQEILRRLLRQYPCYLISNTNRPHFEHIRERFPVINEMSGWILSYEVGFLKPHPAIYRRALEMAKAPAAEIFYVDDRQDLIEAAGKLGFQTHRYEGIDLLRSELRQRKILDGDV